MQIELSNRGYKLPKSTREDGYFDGILGDETKNALLDLNCKEDEEFMWFVKSNEITIQKA